MDADLELKRAQAVCKHLVSKVEGASMAYNKGSLPLAVLEDCQYQLEMAKIELEQAERVVKAWGNVPRMK